MISPLGLPVPKKVTARKQNPSASPGSRNFRDMSFNILRVQPPPQASTATQVGHSTSHSKVVGWAGTRFLGAGARRERAGEGSSACGKETLARRCGHSCSQGRGSGLGEPGCSCRASRAFLRFPGNGNIPLFIFLLPLPSPLPQERCRV